MKLQPLIVVGPLPPPIHGVTVSTSLVLANPKLRERFAVKHLDTSDHRSGRNVGTWDVANALGAMRAAGRLARALRGAPGIVYLPISQSTPGFLRDSLFILLAKARGWRVAAHLRGSDFRAYHNASPRVTRWFIRKVLVRIDSMAVMGETLRSLFEGLVPNDRIAVVANGTPRPTPVDVARDPHHVLFLSNLRRRKGIVEAVEAAVRVLEELSSARFTFAGDWESADLEREIRARAARSNGAIEFVAHVEGSEKARLLASAAVLLFPPVEPEGHPRVVLEALAAGLAIVTTDQGAIRETVVDGDCGYVLEASDPAELADRVLALLVDKRLQARMGQAAKERYKERFTQETADRVLADWLTSLAVGS